MNPSSMATPGLLGSIVMMLSNTGYAMFSVEPKWSALLLSFLFGTIVFNASLSKVRAVVFYLINSLIILSMANGTNSIGYAISRPSAENAGQPTTQSFDLLPSASAQNLTKNYTNGVLILTPTPSAPAINASNIAINASNIVAMSNELIQLKSEVAEQRAKSQPQQQQQQNRFFQQNWFAK